VLPEHFKIGIKEYLSYKILRSFFLICLTDQIRSLLLFVNLEGAVHPNKESGSLRKFYILRQSCRNRTAAQNAHLVLEKIKLRISAEKAIVICQIMTGVKLSF
jgi:hypothetical protein